MTRSSSSLSASQPASPSISKLALPHWQLLSAQTPLSLPELENLLLSNRHLTEPDQIETFFSPLHPFSIALEEVGLSPDQTQIAIQRLRLARDQKQRVLIYGDYDVDGNCATAILWQTLEKFGLIAQPFIPHRQKHGYGLSARSLPALLDLPPNKRPHLIITVDNGIVALDAVSQLNQAGIDVIITDHHQSETSGDLPPALAIIHSAKLCGATVAWFLAREILLADLDQNSPSITLNSLDAIKSFLSSLLDLTALATLADQVPVLGSNRSFIRFGLEILRQGQRLGLLKLCQSAKIEPAEITPHTVDYILGPRINAIGRLKNNLDALRLLCTNSPTRATELANNLELTNQDRRDLTDNLYQLALEQAQIQVNQENRPILIISSPNFHEGIIGLIASRLVEQFSRPALVIAVSDQVAKGSARSLSTINITELIRSVRQHLIEVGGHPLAGGFALDPAHLPVFSEQLWQTAAGQISSAQLQPSISVECSLPAPLLNNDFVPLLDRFQPFGLGNPEFIFQVSVLKLIDQQALGNDQQHLKLTWQDPDSGYTLNTFFWRAAIKFTPAQLPQLNHLYDLLVEPAVNAWRGRRSLQLTLTAFQSLSK